MSEALHTEVYRGHTIEIVHDEFPGDPREEMDNACVMACQHRNYSLGDKDGMEELADEIRRSSYYSPEWESWDNEEALNLEDGADLMKALGACHDILWSPLYLYDHSGITMRMGVPFSCPWDSGIVGVIFMPKAVLEDEFSSDRDHAMKCMKAEVELYDAYITGSVYGYVVEGPDCEDSCFGFYGWEEQEYMIQSAKDAIDYEVNNRIMREQAEEAEHFDQHLRKLKAQIKHHVPLERRDVYQPLY